MKKWSIYILALLLLSACTEEEYIVPDRQDTGKNNSEMTINIKFPQPTTPSTYALTAGEENRINSLEILVFTGGGTGNALDDKFAYSIKVTGGITDSIGPGSVNGSIKKVPVSLKSMKEKQRLILLANKPSEAILASGDTVAGVTKLGAIIDKLKFSGAPWRKDNLSGTDPAFPMWGQMTDSLLVHSTNTSLPSKIEINMIRAVAKIDIGINVNGDPALGFGQVFKIDSVYLCNASDSGYIAPHTDYLKNKPLVTSTGVAYPRPTVQRINYVGYKFADNQSDMVRTIYTPEADTLKGNYKPAFLIIKAKYYEDTYYYRIDFVQDGKYKALLRNNSYLINIVGVRAEGYKLLHDAFTSPVSLHNYSLMLDENDLVINRVITNEQYMLGYSSDHILLDWNESLRIPVKTDYPGGWTASATGDVTFTNKTGGSGNITYLTHTLPNNQTLQSKEFKINLSAGTLHTEITVTQVIGSNSYIGKSNGTIQIPVNSANLGGDVLTGATDLQAKILWTEDNANISFQGSSTNLNKNSILNINAGNTPGNAVIALTKKGSGPGMVGGTAGDEVVWSWHVWITDYDPSTSMLSNNGYIFMDRNMGANGNSTNAASYGVYYQWGRKDPFILGKFTTEVPVSNNLAIAIKNPTIFYTPTATPHDWAGSTQNNNLWNTPTGKKSAYDPCPFGWRVPPVDSQADSPWFGFTRNTRNGITLPLAGGLSMANGQLTEAGSQGYVWNGSISSTEAKVFKFTTATVSHTQSYRANAYPVRCVKDTK